MKYRDKNTINHAIKHEAKMAFDDSTSWTRMYKRYIKTRTKKFLQKISKEDIYWWKSLDNSDRDQIVHRHFNTSITELKSIFIGNIAVIRELKLKELKI